MNEKKIILEQSLLEKDEINSLLIKESEELKISLNKLNEENNIISIEKQQVCDQVNNKIDVLENLINCY